jgi:hypothetical protein
VRALLRKDLPWAVLLASAGGLIHLMAQGSQHAADLWIYPEDQYGPVCLFFLAIAATLLGLLASLSEGLFQTEEYLRHRPVSPARLFWARQLAAAVPLATWVVLVPVVLLGATLLWRNDGALVEAGRLPRLIIEGLPALLFYGLGVFFGALTRRPVVALLLAAAAVVLALVVLVLFTAGTVSALMVPLASVGAALLGVLFLFAAERSARHAPDGDRPWPALRLRWGGPLLALLAAAAGSALVSVAQMSGRELLLEQYPVVVQRGDGAALARNEDHHRYPPVDDRHRDLGAPAQRDAIVLWNPTWLEPNESNPFPRTDRFPGRGRALGGRLCARTGLGPELSVFLCSDGYAELIRTAGHDEERGRAWRRTFARSDGKAFSPRALAVGEWFTPVLLVFEPEDQSLWLLDALAGEPGFRRIELPGGDRFVARAAAGSADAEGPLGRPVLAVQGQRGIYVWQNESFVAPPAGVRARPLPPRAVVPASPAVTFPLVLADETGRTVFQHQYRPHRAGEWAAAVATYAVALARPPLAALAGLAGDRERAFVLRFALLWDPVVAAGDRLVLVPLAVVALLLGWVTRRRLNALGASAARRRFWVGAVLLGGLPVFLCHRVVEGRRAWAALPEEKAPARPLLVAAQAA